MYSVIDDCLERVFCAEVYVRRGTIISKISPAIFFILEDGHYEQNLRRTSC